MKSLSYPKIIKFSLTWIILISIIIFLIYNFDITQISGDSMNPTLINGQVIIFQRTNNIERDNLYGILLENNQFLIAKRIIAIPDDTIEIKNNYIYINNIKKYTTNFPDIPKTQISKDYYFAYGDNQTDSLDSKYLGLIHKTQIPRKIIPTPIILN